ncbi:hypothetical protein D3C86_1128750 [compost metagenome]
MTGSYGQKQTPDDFSQNRAPAHRYDAESPHPSRTFNASVVVVVAIAVATVIAIIVTRIIATTIIVAAITSIIVIPLVVTTSMIMVVISAVPFSIIPVRATASQQQETENGQDRDDCAIHRNVQNIGGIEWLWLLEIFIRTTFSRNCDH